jgi:predicted amidohydrolase
MPRTWVETTHYRGKPGSLAISGNSNAAAYGGWVYTVKGVEAEKWYRFTAWYRAEGLTYEPLQVLARMEWFGGDGRGAGRPDYPYAVHPEGEWTRLTMDAPAPAKAATVKLQLFLANAPQATVWWDDVSLEEIAAPAPRPVTIAAIKYGPRRLASVEEATGRYIETIEKAVPGKADIILLPESLTAASTGLPYAKVAEPVPGPTTERFGELARRRKSYIVAGLTERDGTAIYNTAVLIDREGRVAGKYRKVYIPREEVEAGITPGSSYPVFDTDFGRIGMMICWDVEYADPARALAVQGAEVILMPIWDGTATLVQARAMENRVYLVTSSYGDPNLIIDPKGETQASATAQGTAAIATVDLNRRYVWPGALGAMRGRFFKELRLDIPVKRPGYVR